MEASVIDVGELLREISADSPCGDDLEYDAQYGELERAAEGKPERQIGDVIQPAEAPDWKAVRGLALELLHRTKDLRVAMHLCLALAHTEGFPGLHQGLALTRGLLEKFWDQVHPQLDPDDNNDPTFRLNTLAALTAPELMIGAAREAPLVSSRAMGRFDLRDWEIAHGRLTPPADMQEPPAEAVIDAAFTEVPVEDIGATLEAINGALSELGAIGSRLDEQVGAGVAPDLNPLKALLQEAGQVVGGQLARRGGGSPALEETAAMTDNPSPAPAAAVGGTGVPAALSSREDVVRALDAICDYYRRHEPSSPIPLLMQRAKRLATMDFMAIIRDLAPGAVQQVEEIRGPEGG
jgi:type VI secretion system protein ImpA